MDFKANIDEIEVICNKLNKNTDSLQQEISNTLKIVQDIPNSWSDKGSSIYVEKYTTLVKSLQTLAKAYTSITTEVKNACNKYESLDSTYARKVISIQTIEKGEPIAVSSDGQVYYSSQYGGEYYVCRFNESTGKNEYFPAAADFGRTNVMYDGSGGKLVIRKIDSKTGKVTYIDSPTQTIPKEDIVSSINRDAVSNNSSKQDGKYYLQWYDEGKAQYKYIPADDFKTGEVQFAGGASLVKYNAKTGKYEAVSATSR